MPKGEQLILFDRDLQASPRVVSPLWGKKAMVQEELDDALGLARYAWGPGRQGDRKGLRRRTFTTRNGRRPVAHDDQPDRGPALGGV
jgi:hypothetical protein